MTLSTEVSPHIVKALVVFAVMMALIWGVTHD